MSETGDKILKPSTLRVQASAERTAFFGKSAGENNFFSGFAASHSFFSGSNSIQAKLNVSKPDDPQEKEADQMADRVMTMPEPAATPVEERKEEQVQRKEEEKEEKVQTKPFGVQLMEAPKEEEKQVQRSTEEMENKEEEKIQAKCEACEQEEKEKGATVQTKPEPFFTTTNNNRRNISLHPSDVVQLSGRGPPANSKSFEHSLADSKGGGSPLPESTQSFMESRFSADFSGVRVHTGSNAESMNRQVNAQAFAHGNDIYFNSGKYSPNTSSGGLLLAHELTHTIQQGASKPLSSPGTSSIAAKKIVSSQKSVQKSADRTVSTITNSLPSTHNEVREQDTTQVHCRENSTVSNLPIPSGNSANDNHSLSNWNVSSNGKLHLASSAPASTPENRLQLKENEAREKEEEGRSVVQPFIQKKYDHSIQTKECIECRAHRIANSDHYVQTQKNLSDSSLNNLSEVKISDHSPQQDRGPPISTQGESGIHRSVIDDALEFAGSVTDCITTDIDEAIRCGTQKAQQVALHIPGYRALRVVLGEDPITHEHIERNGRNFIEAAFDIMPGGSLLQQKLVELELLDRAAAWIDTQIARVEALVNGLISAITRFWNGLSWTDFSAPLDVLRDGVNIVLGFINQVVDFAVSVASELLTMVKDYLLSKIVDFIKEQTPAYPLLTVILGRDPITDQAVERNGTNILNALLELGGEEGRLQRTQMQDTGSFQRVADYIDQGIAVFSGAYEQIVAGFHNIWNNISIESLMDPVGTFQMIYNEFAQPVRQVWDFVSEVGAVILRFIKEVLMQRLAAWARTVRGYALVTVIIGKDPFTDEVVPRTMENIIRGFMSLMEGGEEQFNQLKESGAIDRTVGRINAAVASLNMTPAYIVQLFVDLWNSFSLNDLIHPIEAFQRIIDRFGEPIGRLIAFVWEILKIVIETILRLMNFPLDLISNIITKALLAIDLIKRDPVGFLKNLLRAIKQGFIQFFDNILQHLLQGLAGWLMSELRDANMPPLPDLTLRGVIGWVLEVLGISMERIWQKLAEHPRIGPQRVARIRSMISTLEGIWTFIRDVQERGVAAIWERIVEQLTNLWDTVLDAVKNWIMERIITQVVTRLLSMLDPTGIMAVVNSAIALYSAIQSFIRYLREMLEIVNSFVEGTVEIASGNVTRAANFLERTLARAIPIVIGFLANQVGLSGIGRRIGEMIERVREMVDRALTWLVNRAVDTGMALIDRLMAFGRSAVGAVAGWLGLRKTFATRDGQNHSIFFTGSGAAARLMVASDEIPFATLITNKRAEVSRLPAGTEKTSKEAALASTDTLFDQINSTKASLQTATTDEQRRPLEQQLNTHFDNMAPHLVILGVAFASDSDLPVTVIQPTPGNGGRAQKVVADPLTKKPDPNYTPYRPDADPPGWSTHIMTIPDYENFYVRLHILSEKLGGPGREIWNLTPGRKTENTNMEGQAETPAYNLTQQNRVLWYESEVAGYRTNPPFTDFVTGIRVRYGFKEKNDSGQWARVGDVSYNNLFPVTQPDPPGSRDPVPSINTMGFDYWENVLVRIPGRPNIREYRAFVTARNARGGYGTWDEMIRSPEFIQLKNRYPDIESWFTQTIQDGKLRGI